MPELTPLEIDQAREHLKLYREKMRDELLICEALAGHLGEHKARYEAISHLVASIERDLAQSGAYLPVRP
jgi:hypothetical protein